MTESGAPQQTAAGAAAPAWLVPVVVVASLFLAVVVLSSLRAIGVNPASLRYDAYQPAPATVALGIGVYAILIGFLLAAQRWIAGAPLRALGMRSGAARGLSLGFLIGLAIASAGKSLILLAVPGSQLTFTPPPAIDAWLVAVAVALAFLLLNSVHEELLFRAFPLSHVRSGAAARWSAIVVLSTVFSLLHFSTSPASAPAFLSRFGLGVFLSLLFLRSGSLWILVGAHSGLNLVSWQFSGNSGGGALWSLTSPGSAGQWTNAGLIALAAVVAGLLPKRPAPASFDVEAGEAALRDGAN